MCITMTCKFFMAVIQLSHMKGRPSKKEKYLFEERKRLIINSIEKGFTQTEVADIFRLPRNTVHQIVKENYKQIKSNILNHE